MKSEELLKHVKEQQLLLEEHSLYQEIQSLDDVRQFMQVHLFAVWDFMSLLKRIQNTVTSMDIPWMPSRYSKKAVRLINEIVLAEESDECPVSIHPSGYCDHFSMYLSAMKELGVHHEILFETIKYVNLSVLPKGVSNFVGYHLDLASNGSIEQVAGSFLFGREKLLPELFEKIVAQIKQHHINCPALLFYLERHIEIDGENHGEMAEDLFDEICDSEESKILGLNSALESLRLRNELWSQVRINISGRQTQATARV